jgi:hypothetical protein
LSALPPFIEKVRVPMLREVASAPACDTRPNPAVTKSVFAEPGGSRQIPRGATLVIGVARRYTAMSLARSAMK